MRAFVFIVLLTSLSLFSACSYLTDFAVINESENPIEIRYRIKAFPGEPAALSVNPCTIVASRLSRKGNQQWNQLSPSQYQLDQESRVVIVRLMPDEALRVASMHKYEGHDNAWDAENFPVEEITITGSGDDLRLLGEQARRGFSEVSEALYTMTYK